MTEQHNSEIYRQNTREKPVRQPIPLQTPPSYRQLRDEEMENAQYQSVIHIDPAE